MTNSEHNNASTFDSLNPIGTAAFGFFLIMLGAFILYFARDIRTFSLGSDDPGPKALPIATGVILLAGGLLQIISAFVREGLTEALKKRPTAVDHSTGRGGLRRASITLGSLLLYVIAMNWLGFITASSIFLIGLLKYFGSSWRGALLATIVIIGVIAVLFQSVFQVSLPAGLLGELDASIMIVRWT